MQLFLHPAILRVDNSTYDGRAGVYVRKASLGKRCFKSSCQRNTELTNYNAQRHMRGKLCTWDEKAIPQDFHFKLSCLCNSTYFLWCSEKATAICDGLLYVRKTFVFSNHTANAKVLTSFDVERVNITCCGGQMNVRGLCHKRCWLKSFRQCNSTYVLKSWEEWRAYANMYVRWPCQEDIFYISITNLRSLMLNHQEHMMCWAVV
jgi:hypothetical protein